MPSRSKLYTIAFIVTFILWTIGLLIPVPKESATKVLDTEYKLFVAGKMLHISAYAFLTVLAGLLTLSTRHRWWLLGLLSFHGFATEFFQQFVNRGASLRDVGLDHIGIVLGLMAGWRRWRVLVVQCSPHAEREDYIAQKPEVPK